MKSQRDRRKSSIIILLNTIFSSAVLYFVVNIEHRISDLEAKVNLIVANISINFGNGKDTPPIRPPSKGP